MTIRKVLMLVVVLALCTVFFVSCEPSQPQPNPSSTQDSAYLSSTEAPTLPETPHTRFAQPEGARWLEQGEYMVGNAVFPEGEYYLETYDPSLVASFSVFKLDAEEKKQVIKENSFQNFCFVQLEEGQNISVKFARILPAALVPPIQPQDGAYPAGVYRIGKDIPEGEYCFIDAQGILSPSVALLSEHLPLQSMADVAQPGVLKKDSAFNRLYFRVDVGAYLKVRDAVFYPRDEAPLPETRDGSYGAGMYLVGKDIEAGQYLVEPDGQSADGDGLYAILTDPAAPVGTIVEVKTIRSEKSISVENGQYLSLTNSMIRKR